MTTKNLIQFRKGFFNLPQAPVGDKATAMSFISEIMQLGYMPSQKAMDMLLGASTEDLVQLYNDVLPPIKKMMGANANYKPFWPGFPEQVMAMSELELWVHQLVHYWTRGAYLPNDWTKERSNVFERNSWTGIDVGTEADFDKVFTDLVSVNQSLTKEDLEIVEWFAKSGRTLVFPASIPFKENLCTLAKYKLDVPVKTTTDVLRIAIGMSGGDISMPPVPPKTVSAKVGRRSYAIVENTAREKFNFAKFNRADRKYLLGLLDKTNCDVRDMAPKAGRWVRLAEVLHPGEYYKQFPRACAAIKSVRDSSAKSYMSQVDSAFAVSFEAGIKKLSERPGVFARMLDSLFRKALAGTPSHTKVQLLIDNLSLLDSVSNKVLFELYRHMETRRKDTYSSTVRVKGTRKTRTIEGKNALPTDVVDQIQSKILQSVKAKFAKLDPMGKVFIDENLKKMPVPTDMRSLNPALRPTIRGERVPMGVGENAKVVRAFVHWMDHRGDQDVDLGVTFVGRAGIAGIGWNTQKNASFGTFSGDIRYVQGPCAEYVDIRLSQALADGYRYALVQAYDYTRRGFHKVPDCCFGWMERENAQNGAIFVPKTIENAVQIRCESVGVLVAIVDLETLEYIYIDEDLEGFPVATMNVNDLLALVDRYSSPPKISAYDILSMHVEARGGELAPSQEGTDQCFSFGDFSGSYVELLKYMGV